MMVSSIINLKKAVQAQQAKSGAEPEIISTKTAIVQKDKAPWLIQLMKNYSASANGKLDIRPEMGFSTDSIKEATAYQVVVQYYVTCRVVKRSMMDKTIVKCATKVMDRAINSVQEAFPTDDLLTEISNIYRNSAFVDSFNISKVGATVLGIITKPIIKNGVKTGAEKELQYYITASTFFKLIPSGMNLTASEYGLTGEQTITTIRHKPEMLQSHTAIRAMAKLVSPPMPLYKVEGTLFTEHSALNLWQRDYIMRMVAPDFTKQDIVQLVNSSW